MELAVTKRARRKFTRAEFDRLVAIGFFDDEHTELLYGELFTMTIGPAHADIVTLLVEQLMVALRGRVRVRPQLPLAASDESEPEPDIAVVPLGRYREEHPTTAIWIVEVADSTLAYDRDVKAPLYAETGVPEYWIVDVDGEAIEIHSKPVNGRYQSNVRHESGRLSPAAFPDVTISIDELFK